MHAQYVAADVEVGESAVHLHSDDANGVQDFKQFLQRLIDGCCALRANIVAAEVKAGQRAVHLHSV